MLIAAAGLGARCCADQHEDCSSTQCWPWLECVAYTDADQQPAETCEIPCAADADCPWEQRCVDLTPGPGPVCMECVGEGEATDDPARCCDGLTALTGCTPGEPCEPGYWCAACGDGVCGEHESPWECPADCADCESLGLDDRACAGLTVRFWADEQRRRTAEELNALPFDERAAEINRQGWFGRTPGTVPLRVRDDGVLAHLSRISLDAGRLGLTTEPDSVTYAEGFLDRWGALLFGCGQWSEVAVSETRVHGSPRATVVDRGSLYIVELPPFHQDPCVNCGVPIHTPWFGYVNPVDRTTLAMLSNMGVTPDVAMDSVWSGHPGWDGGAVSAMASEIPEDYEAENLVHMHTAIRDIMTDDGLGVNRRPLHDDALAPKGAEAEVGLRTLALNGAMSMSMETNPEILEAASLLLPNAVQFITQPPPPDPPPPIALDADLVQGLGRMVGKWALDIQVRTVAVAFLEGDAGADGRRDVVVRQYGVDADPFTPVDTVIGRARFAPGLATLGETSFVDLKPQGTEHLQRDNVVACADFAYDGMSDTTNQRMRCKVFKGGAITHNGGRLEKLWPEGATVGPAIELAASPRAVNVGDTAYIFYRESSGFAKYVAFAGVDFDPVTYNAVLAGLVFPDDFNGPRKLVTHVDTEASPGTAPSKPDVGLWPLMRFSPFSTSHGGLGYLGAPGSLWLRGPWTP